MTAFFKALKGEMKKQHLNYFYSKTIYISLFVWPILHFITTYYSFKPFNINNSNIPYLNEDNMIIFILLGYMTMSLFRSLVQSAWKFSFERVSGTLELIYLSPASRQGVILGNALSSLFESVVFMVLFSIGILIFKKEVLNINYLSLIIVCTITITMAILWGMLLNTLFLFSRDSGFLFSMLEETMETFAGVKVPTTLFPMWAKIISLIFPLTYAVEAVRRVMLDGSSIADIKKFILIGIVIIIVLYFSSVIIIKIVENHSRKTGNFTYF
ncbi:ABC-2 type transport system permease protein [Hathewaya proteolytica DSM 3090]|uniref:Transport permease protein n=1 Tax=Hathewaya proteolytica DSM 3090 TaxID=1121331 RepID=A0A1M6RAF7_9CLOT|nr:ABC transporter permease [Hathewaya proteolytica]SHK29318.1 ABC-2 type transport system permease protein [Hathewaya proteolytica DSM 3090]